MKMNIAEWALQLMLLLPVSFVSAAAVSYFVPRAGAVEVEADGLAQMDADFSGATKLKSGTDVHTERIVQSQWEKQRRWALVYKKRRSELQKARVAKLTFISVGACLQVAATQVPPAWKATTALAGGALTALGGVLKNKFVTPDHVSKMVTSFYIQQAIKSEIYKFRTKAFPYDKNKNDALQQLRTTCNTLSKNGDDKMYNTMSKDNKPIPGDMSTKELYISKRVDPRINKFLIGRGKKMAAKGRFCSRVEDGLIAAGTTIGFLSTQTLPGNMEGIIGGLTGWAAAFTTVSAAFANHHAKMKFEEIADQYFDTAEELSDIVETWPIACTKAGDPGWDDMVNKCEDLIISTTEEFAKKRTGGKDLAFTKPSKPVRERYAEKVWNPSVICGNDESGSYPAKDRAIYLVETEGKTMKEAREMVMAEFPENF